eukprot:366128-Chlamydomonas_euryale.AAC.6
MRWPLPQHLSPPPAQAASPGQAALPLNPSLPASPSHPPATSTGYGPDEDLGKPSSHMRASATCQKRITQEHLHAAAPTCCACHRELTRDIPRAL